MEDIRTFLISDIKEITPDKIIYRDNQSEREIILKDCAINYANEYNSNVESYITWEGNPAEPLNIEENRCIGERDWFDDKPYFVFFSNPKIRFELIPRKCFLDYFDKHWIHRKYYDDFYSVQQKLEEYHWYTFDLG